MDLIQQPTDLKTQLAAFPGFGYEFEPGRWRIQVAGVARLPFTPTLRKRMLLKILSNVLGLADNELLSPQYFERIRPFVSDGASGRQIVVTLGNERMLLPKRTKRNGHFSQTMYLPNDVVQGCSLVQGRRRILPLDYSCDEAGAEKAASPIFLMQQKGLSVISDIDDTIKDTIVKDRKELLANTFLRPFRCVEGMAAVYDRWHQQGADFHYVSSSPWQLLKPLLDMLSQGRFPEGSIHLRYFRLRNHMLQKMIRIKRSGKITSLRRVFSSMKDRKFLLVGDSGEKDLDLYRSVARRYPAQVMGVFIRDIPGHHLEKEKLEKFNSQISGVPCHVFSDASQLDELATPIIAKVLRGQR